jgi:integrase
MASISTAKDGNRRILFFGIDGKKKAIRVGKASKRATETLKVLVEQLLVAKKTGHALDPDIICKVDSLHPAVRTRLEKLGLVFAKRTPGAKVLSAFITDYVQTRIKVKPATKEIWRQGEKSLLGFFGAGKSLGEVTPGDADEYLEHLRGTKLAPMTVRKRLQFAKMVFRAATRKKLIPTDPFSDVSFIASKPDKSFFVTPEMIAKVIAACPDHHWRMIVILSRYGGLRCPSEVLSLKWEDINWAEGKIVVPSPKTEHHPGKESRVIPLFPELHAQLRECFEAAPVGSVYVIGGTFRQAAMGPFGWRNCNLNVRLRRIVKNAGLTAWPRIFHNLRSSRQTELAEVFPSHVVCAWLGNSEDIAKKHYYQVTDAHFAQAAASANPAAREAVTKTVQTPAPREVDGVNGRERAPEGDAKSDALATQNPTQQAAAPSSTETHDWSQLVTAEAVMRLHAELCGNVRNTQTDGVGFEPTSRFRDCRFSRPVHSTALPPIQIQRTTTASADP